MTFKPKLVFKRAEPVVPEAAKPALDVLAEMVADQVLADWERNHFRSKPKPRLVFRPKPKLHLIPGGAGHAEPKK